jgi:hypothetical protein
MESNGTKFRLSLQVVSAEWLGIVFSPTIDPDSAFKTAITCLVARAEWVL